MQGYETRPKSYLPRPAKMKYADPPIIASHVWHWCCLANLFEMPIETNTCDCEDGLMGSKCKWVVLATFVLWLDIHGLKMRSCFCALDLRSMCSCMYSSRWCTQHMLSCVASWSVCRSTRHKRKNRCAQPMLTMSAYEAMILPEIKKPEKDSRNQFCLKAVSMKNKNPVSWLLTPAMQEPTEPKQWRAHAHTHALTQKTHRIQRLRNLYSLVFDEAQLLAAS